MSLTIENVWRVAEQLAAASASDPRNVLDECGLFLEIPLERWEYFCTPKNTLTFASTGGDGVHYGLLQLPGLPKNQQPVVMTVPMGDRHNIVVAENLTEFLNLGYHVGWFSLEQIVYEPDEAVEYHSGPDPEPWPERDELLVALRSELSLSHQPLSLVRIEELESKYRVLVIANDEP